MMQYTIPLVKISNHHNNEFMPQYECNKIKTVYDCTSVQTYSINSTLCKKHNRQ